MIKLKLTVCSVFLGVVSTFPGCRTGQGICNVDRCADVPCGAIPAPAGSYLCNWQQAQVASASIDLGVFYQSDFVGDSVNLSPSAEQQVARLVQQGAVGTIPIVIEPSNDPQRDAGRVYMLASAFSAAGYPMSADHIQVAHPAAIGLEGFQAQQIAHYSARRWPRWRNRWRNRWRWTRWRHTWRWIGGGYWQRGNILMHSKMQSRNTKASMPKHPGCPTRRQKSQFR